MSIVPGTSRSGSTILGSRILGIARPAAAEFSFFMGIPAMVGASLIKGYGFFDYVSESGASVPALAWIVLAVASLVAFAVSMVAIKFLMELRFLDAKYWQDIAVEWEERTGKYADRTTLAKKLEKYLLEHPN